MKTSAGGCLIREPARFVHWINYQTKQAGGPARNSALVYWSRVARFFRNARIARSPRAGDAAARNQLLERHREALRRMIGLRMDPVLQRRVDASDIVQDVLVEAHRRLADYLQARACRFSSGCGTWPATA